METGIAQGFKQLTLALFTTLAPAGSICFIFLLVYGFFFIKSENAKRRLQRFLIIPLSFSLVGLIASTNHLGNPSNALYVLTGVGRSPLSNEVIASAAFVGIAWIFWLAGFSKKVTIKHLRCALPFAITAGLAQIWFTSFAYNIETISSWSLVFTPVNQILSALVGGCALSLFTLAFAEIDCSKTTATTIIIVACVSTILLFTSELIQSTVFYTLASTTTLLPEIFPQYPLFLAGSTILLFAACVLLLICKGRKNLSSRCSTLAILFVTMLGIFLTRFTFYCTYLNVGLVV